MIAKNARSSHVRRSLHLRGRTHRLVVVADTHGRPHPNTEALIQKQRPDAILHAGDIGDLFVLDSLEALAPVFAVRGNIDTPARELSESMTLEVNEDRRLLIRILLLHIGQSGTALRADARRLAAREGAGLVICGHSHLPFIGRDGEFAILNPGSVGPRRFLLPIVLGVMEFDESGVRMHHVDCETGEVWQPVALGARPAQS